MAIIGDCGVFRRFQRTFRVGLAHALTALALVVSGLTPASAQQPNIAGEVRRVDASGGKITLKHGAVPELELPAMTLVYQAAPALLRNLKPGDKVRFAAKRENQQYVVTAISR